MRSSTGASMRAAKLGKVLREKGSARFIWNTSGRHDTWGHTSTPEALAVACSAITRS